MASWERCCAIEIDSDFANAYYNRGVAHYYSNNEPQALDDWEQAERLGSVMSDAVLSEMARIRAEQTATP